jgi:hypothetical protein
MVFIICNFSFSHGKLEKIIVIVSIFILVMLFLANFLKVFEIISPI